MCVCIRTGSAVHEGYRQRSGPSITLRRYTYQGVHQSADAGDGTFDPFGELAADASPVAVGVRLHLARDPAHVVHVKEGVILPQQRPDVLTVKQQ
jgi:hypothetical protein